VDSIVTRLEHMSRSAAPSATTPAGALAVVTSMDIRRYVRRMIAARLPRLQVYSYQELGEHLALKPVGRVAM